MSGKVLSLCVAALLSGLTLLFGLLSGQTAVAAIVSLVLMVGVSILATH